MAIKPADNYVDPVQPAWADNDADKFDRLHVADTTQALDRHDHNTGRGLPVQRVGQQVLGSSTAMVWAMGVLP